MKHFVIISGGTIDDSFADRWFEEEKPDAVIAADAGMEYLYRSHRVPDVIVGDFDSVGTEALAYFKTLPGVAIQKLIPEKILKMIQRIVPAIRVRLPDFMMNLPVMVLAVIFQTRIREDFQMEAILVPHRIMLPLEMTDL